MKKSRFCFLLFCVVTFAFAQSLCAQSPKEHFNSGLKSYKEGKYDEAIASFTEAIKIYPKHVEAYYNRGTAYRSKGLHDKAKSDWKKAASLGFSHAKDSLKQYYRIDVK